MANDSNPDYMRNMLLGLSAENLSAPVMSKEFEEKQAAVLNTPEGRALAERLMAYKMKVLEDIAFSTERGRQVLAKYQADVENAYRMLAAEHAGRAVTERQDERIREMEARIASTDEKNRELEARIQSLMRELGAPQGDKT